MTNTHRNLFRLAAAGLFVRFMVGLDRAAATNALSAFTASSTLTGNQLVQLVAALRAVRSTAEAS